MIKWIILSGYSWNGILFAFGAVLFQVSLHCRRFQRVNWGLRNITESRFEAKGLARRFMNWFWFDSVFIKRTNFCSLKTWFGLQGRLVFRWIRVEDAFVLQNGLWVDEFGGSRRRERVYEWTQIDRGEGVGDILDIFDFFLFFWARSEAFWFVLNVFVVNLTLRLLKKSEPSQQSLNNLKGRVRFRSDMLLFKLR